MTRILIVDDEEINVRFLNTALRKYATCIPAYNGREAVEVFSRAYESGEPFDLVLLDIMMPEMDGQEALLKMREYEKEKGVERKAVIIMATALDDADNMMKAFSEECQDYMTKPIRLKELREELAKYGITLEKETGST